MKYEIDHVGIAVESLEQAKVAYLAMGWEDSPSEEVKSEKVRVQMFNLENNSRLELIEPTDDSSPIAKFLKKRGPGIHHICLRVKDIRQTLAKLKEAGLQLVHEEPFQGAHNCQVAFVHPKSTGGVLIELSQPGDSE